MIQVCDAIMGSGKSQSAISYMNQHADQHFVYITPYLEEAARIKRDCPSLNFVEPNNKRKEYRFSKTEHTRALLKQGKNIATTHSAFRFYTLDMIESIQKHQYILIIDEAVDVLREQTCNTGDIQLLLEGGYAEVKNNAICWTGKEYHGEALADLYKQLKCGNLLRAETEDAVDNMFYWMMGAEVIKAFHEVYILTYLFFAQELKYFLDIHNMPYRYIGIRREGEQYFFAEEPEYTPPYVYQLKEKIQIFAGEKLNEIGQKKHALSANWYKTHEEEKEILKNHLYNFMRNYHHCTSKERMWSTFRGNINALKGKGYTKQYVNFNAKASNEYRDRWVLAYCVNIFASPLKVRFFAKHGVQYNEEGFALSTMIQWIWRSAIRDGKAIDLYLPSSRMRSLLNDWLRKVGENDGRM